MRIGVLNSHLPTYHYTIFVSTDSVRDCGIKFPMSILVAMAAAPEIAVVIAIPGLTISIVAIRPPPIGLSAVVQTFGPPRLVTTDIPIPSKGLGLIQASSRAAIASIKGTSADEKVVAHPAVHILPIIDSYEVSRRRDNRTRALGQGDAEKTAVDTASVQTKVA